MVNVAQDHPTGQELIHFCHFDHNTYESFIKSPGRPAIPFLQAREFDYPGCLLLSHRWPKEIPPGGIIPIPTVNVPAGSLHVFALALLFYLVPMLKDQPRQAVIVHNPDLDPGPAGIDDVAMVVITQAWPLQDPQPEPSPVPEEKRPHLRIVPPKAQPPLPKVMHDIPPQDVLDKIKARNPPPSVLVINAALFRFSWCGSSKHLFNWHERNHRDSKWVHQGIKALAKITGYEDKQVKRALEWLDLHNFIYKIHQGFRDEDHTEGYSIYELPKDMTTVEVFRHKKAMKTIRKIGC
jgi:hypothetical protein